MENGAAAILDVGHLLHHCPYKFKYIFMLVVLCYSISVRILVPEMSDLVIFKLF